MDSLGETLWDVVIYGTGLQESLLALSLSRSGKNILHIDPNGYYGGLEASLGLQDAEAWAQEHSSPGGAAHYFRSASATRSSDVAGLSSPRTYSLSLSPQIIHTRSELLSQLVSSRAYRQVEFLAVGSFFVFTPPSEPGWAPALVRIPSTREDVFSDATIPARAKRSLMKFLKFVLDYEGPQHVETWRPLAEAPLSEFLRDKFGFDAHLESYVRTLTLSLRESITTGEGLAMLHRHLTSMGMFGAGFAAVYPKWSGISEISQVACRAGAVGGAVYMLGTTLREVTDIEGSDKLRLGLSNVMSGDVCVETRLLVRGGEHFSANRDTGPSSRLVAVIDSPLKPLFETVVEGAPTPAVAVIAVPGEFRESEAVQSAPIFVFAHSSETGECPPGQSILYLSTLAADDTDRTKSRLESALSSILEAVDKAGKPQCLYRFYYECVAGEANVRRDSEGKVLILPGTSSSLTFDDSDLEPVHEAWKMVVNPAVDNPETGYMKFIDREGPDEYDNEY